MVEVEVVISVLSKISGNSCFICLNIIVQSVLIMPSWLGRFC